MFIEPTLLDIKTQWDSNRDNFHVTTWKDTALTPAEWAWIKHPSFWEANTKSVPLRNDNISWWDWSATHLTGNSLQTSIKTLLALQVKPDVSSLTSILNSAVTMKLGLSKLETQNMIKFLTSYESMSFKNKNGENPWDSTLASRDSNILSSILTASLQVGINPASIINSKTGNNLLHIAVLHNWEAGVQLLIESGVDTSGINNNGQTPKEMAIELGHKGSLRGFSLKKEIPSVKKQPPINTTSSQLDLF